MLKTLSPSPRSLVATMIASLLLSITCIESSHAQVQDFEWCVNQAKSCEQSGKDIQSLVFYSAAARANPGSDQVRQKQAFLVGKLNSAAVTAATARNAADESALRAFFQDFMVCWNNHDVEGMRRFIAREFLSADGITCDNLLNLARDTWTAYPTAKVDFQVKEIKTMGDYAEVETVANFVGNTQYMAALGIAGNMSASIHDMFAMKKTSEGWKATGQFMVDESSTISYGNTGSINAQLSVPRTVAPGKQYQASLNALLPAGMTAMVAIARGTATYPVVEPTYSWMQLAGSNYSNQLIANNQGNNEEVTARLNVSNAYTGTPMGMLYITKRVNVVDTINAIALQQELAKTASQANSSNAAAVQTQNSVSQSNFSNTSTTVSTQDKIQTTVMSKLANKPVRDKWAVIVGVGDFQDQKIPKLKYATKDAIDFYKFLETKGNFKRDHMRLLLNEKATQRRILTELATLFLHRVAEPEDLIVVYFSTHGSPTEEGPGGNNYIVAYDTTIDELFATGVSMQTIMETLKNRISSERILLVLDACHSGATTIGAKGMSRVANFDAESIAQGTGQLVICSSDPAERSWESKRAANGVFTKQLMDALSKDGTKTRLGDAFKYLQSQVAKEVKEDRGQSQTPILKSKWDGAELEPLLPPSRPQELPASLKQELPPDSSDQVK